MIKQLKRYFPYDEDSLLLLSFFPVVGVIISGITVLLSFMLNTFIIKEDGFIFWCKVTGFYMFAFCISILFTIFLFQIISKIFDIFLC